MTGSAPTTAVSRFITRFGLTCVATCLLLGPAAAQEKPDDKPTEKTAAKTPEKPAEKDAATDRTPPANRPTVAPRQPRAAARTKGDITFDDLKFDIEKGGKFEDGMLTKEIKGLDKQTVKLRGYILPNSVYKSSGIENFVLVRDNMECCFGPGAAIYDCVIVNMEKGKTTDFTTKPVAVRGKFEIEEYKFPDGTLAAIYKITALEAK